MDAGAAVAVMLAQVQDEAPARDLAIERGARVKAMVPVDLEAEEIQIELVRLGDVENPEDRDDLVENDLHRLPPFTQIHGDFSEVPRLGLRS